MIEPITSFTPLTALESPPGTLQLPPTHAFSNVVAEGIGQVNQSLVQADDATRALAAGHDIPVHDVMIALEQARLDLQFAVQVRNRVVSAYHDIVNMQV